MKIGEKMGMRIGIGQDSHEFENEKEKPLMLGGIKVDGANGLKANSDGDVVLHAVFNAISSGCGKNSLGEYADKMCKEDGIADSAEYLVWPKKFMKEAGLKLSSVSISLECRKPRLAPITVKMKERIAEILEIPPERVGITATTGENLTAFGRGEGIMCTCAVLLEEE